MAHASPSAATGNPLLSVLKQYGLPYWPYLLLGLCVDLVIIVLQRIPEFVIGIAIDAVFLQSGPYALPLLPAEMIPDGRLDQLWFTIALLVGVLVVRITVQVVGSLATGWATKAMVHDARTDVYDSMQRLSMSYFEGRQTGDLIAILSNDVRNLQWFFRNSIQSFIRFPISVAVAFGFMAILNWQLAVLLLFAPVLIGAISYWYARRVSPVYEDLRERIGDLNAELQRNISGIRTIKAYTAEERERDRIRSVASERLDTQLAQAKYESSIGPSTSAVTNVGVLIILGFGGYWVLFGPPAFFSGSLTPGALYIFISYTRSFVGPMRNIPDIIDNYADSLASANRIQPLRDPVDVIPDAEDARDLTGVAGRVTFDDVTFGYGDEEATIRDVSFEAAPGDTIGIVGPTGAGKSTIMKLLFRYADPDEGSIRIDGTDIRDVTRRSLRSHLGYVEQEPFLFYGTVRENIAYAVEDVADDDVEQAAIQAGAHQFITELEDGYDTEVGERGVKLSGGQRQRIAIARTIIADPAILVFDEATSHVDNETEALIQRNLADLIEDRTAFVIAHRLSTVRDADQILVVEDGDIVERGTHEALLDEDGLYADLWRVQVGDVASLSAEFVEQTRRRSLEVDE